MAFNAAQWQAYASKNQLVLGPNGGQGVISVEDFGQVSTIKIPDPGQSTTDFILANVAAGTQTINGNLTVTGTFTPSGGSGGEVLLNGNLVFNNAADREITWNADQTSTGAKLSILGNDSNGGAGGAVAVTSGAATSGTFAGGALSLAAGAGSGAGTGGATSLAGGQGGATGAGGVLSVTSGAGGSTSGASGALTVASGVAGGASGGNSGDVKLASGTSAAGSTGTVTVISGVPTSGSSGTLVLQTGSPTTGVAGAINLNNGDSSSGLAGGNLIIHSGNTTGATAGTLQLQSGNGGTGGTGGQLLMIVGSGTVANGTVNIAATSTIPAAINIGQVGMTGPTTVFAQVKPVVTIATAPGPTALTLGQSGSVVYINNTATLTITLPAVTTAGQYFKIVEKVNPAADHIITAGSAIIRGSVTAAVTTAPALVVGTAGATNVNFIGGASLLGDWVEFISDGASWFIGGQSRGTAGITLT